MTIKIAIILLLTASSLTGTAQTDSLASQVYSWRNSKVTSTPQGERRQFANGKTLDLSRLEVHTTTLLPGKTNHAPARYNDHEELVIVKDGALQVNLNGKQHSISAGGLALIVAGDEQQFTNTSAQPVTYYVLSYFGNQPIDINRGQTGGGSFIIDWNDMQVKQTDKGESRPIFDRPSSVFPNFDVHATALNPGISSHAAHTHRAEEIILMIKGSGEMQIGSEFHKATAGDVILVNANVPHAFTNTGNVQCGYFAIQWHDK